VTEIIETVGSLQAHPSPVRQCRHCEHFRQSFTGKGRGLRQKGCKGLGACIAPGGPTSPKLKRHIGSRSACAAFELPINGQYDLEDYAAGVQ